MRPLLPAVALALTISACPTGPEQPPPEPESPCPDGEVLDGDVCVPAACGTGPWGDVDRTGAVVHVAPWGVPEGDGSEADPVDSIQTAIDLAADGAAEVVAVELGVWNETLSFSRAVNSLRIEGRCAEGVRLDGGGVSHPTVAVLGGVVQLGGMEIRGGSPAIFVGRIQGGLPTDLLLSNLTVTESPGSAIAASGDGVFVGLEYVTVTDAPALDDGSGGRGLSVEDGASASGVGLEVFGADEYGVYASDPGTELALLATHIEGSGRGGVRIEGGASLVADRLVLEGNRGVALRVIGPSAGAQLTETEIRGTEILGLGSGAGLVAQAQASIQATGLMIIDGEGPGLVATTGGAFVCDDCTISGNSVAGVAALGSGIVQMSGGTIADSQSTLDQPGSGVGVYAWGQGELPTLDLSSITLSGHSGPAMYLREPGRYSLADSVLDDSGIGDGVAALVAALDGVGRWEGGEGLLLLDTDLTHVPLDGMVLHASSATMDGTTFETAGGFDIYLQECAGVPAPVDTSGAAIDNGCEGAPRVIEPRIEVLLP